MEHKAISVIIANLDGEAFINDCLLSLHRQVLKDFDVIVVDNGSKDRSLEMIRRDFPWVKTIVLDGNRGFAKANNIGFENTSSKYIATLNNDALPDPGWLEALHEAAERDDRIGMVASKIFLGREGSVLDSAGLLIHPDGMTRQLGRGEEDSGQYDGVVDVLFPSACAALYRREMLDEIGMFDEDFVSYCEDSDLGLRARLKGWRAVLAPGATVRHLYSRTGGGYSKFKAYLVERNHCWVLLKNFPATGIIVAPFHALKRYLVQVYAVLTGKGAAARYSETSGLGSLIPLVIKAYLAALKGAVPMLKKRKGIWRSRSISRKKYGELLRRYRIRTRDLILKD